VNLMPLALQSYAPDGGWAEGPGYWHYATRYTVYFLAALDAALGKDFGLSDYPGMAEAGHFRMHFCSPVGQTFSYADAGSGIGGAHKMFWLSKRYNQPMFAFQQREILKKHTPSALDLIWFSDAGADPAKSGFPLDGVYTGIDVAMFRSAWNDPNAIFVGFKGGDNKANHSHLDLGTFVLDAEDVRWAIDLGSDNYNMPGYFGKQRWTYFRLNTLSHNTLVVNNSNQDPMAPAPIIDSHFDDKFSYAVADLSKGYHDLQKAHRGVALINRSTVLVQDEFSSDTAVDVQWEMMTDSNIKLDGPTAVLTKDGKTLTATILSPSNAKFEVIDGNPPKPQRQLKNAKKLVINLNGSKGDQTVSVMFQPQGFAGKTEDISKVKALKNWTD
ncbi:heparinase II/III-family protein, partial [bacterium]|nr:heparinase II/III-family protein [bacterium]